jgi:hypothetical protein
MLRAMMVLRGQLVKEGVRESLTGAQRMLDFLALSGT